MGRELGIQTLATVTLPDVPQRRRYLEGFPSSGVVWFRSSSAMVSSVIRCRRVRACLGAQLSDSVSDSNSDVLRIDTCNDCVFIVLSSAVTVDTVG